MDNILLYFFSFVLLGSALKTILSKHPAYGALYLASSMISLAGIFFILGFPFLAGLQLIIYAGAVIVLFVMVVMLFEYKDENNMLSSNPIHLGLPIFLLGLTGGVIAIMALSTPAQRSSQANLVSVQDLATKLFTKYILIFELLGLLLLLVAIGVVILIRLDRK